MDDPSAKKPRKPSYKLTFEDAVHVWPRVWAGEIQSRIAAFFDTNQGRISEVVTEKDHIGSKQEAIRRFGAPA